MEERISKIKSKLTALEGKKYERNGMVGALATLKKQMYAAVPEVAGEDLTTRRILRHFEERNAQLNGVADTQLKTFAKLSAQFDEMFLIHRSGTEGEKKAFKSLETVKRPCRILKNVQFECKGHVTEIDLLAITNRAIFVIEAKNVSKNVVITKNGDYFRENPDASACFEKNIGVQMNEKEHVLRSVLRQGGIDNANIQSLVVFTNSQIRVDNQYPYVKTCYLSELPHIIEEYEGVLQYHPRHLNRFTEILIGANKNIKWPVPMDIAAFKDAFARLLVTLEVAEEEKARRENSFFGRLCSFFERLFGKRTKVATPC